MPANLGRSIHGPPSGSLTTIVVLGGSDQTYRDLREIGERHNWVLLRCKTLADAFEQIESGPPVLVLCEAALWRELLGGLHERRRKTPVVVFTPLADEDLWLDVLEAGGHDVLLAPFVERELTYTVNAVGFSSARAGIGSG